MFKEKHFLKIIGIFTQLLLGWIVIALIVSVIMGFIWLFGTIQDFLLAFGIFLFLIGLSLMAYKIGNELIGEIYR